MRFLEFEKLEVTNVFEVHENHESGCLGRVTAPKPA
jgi:hypothetical protein